MCFGLKELHLHPSCCRESALTATFCEMSFGYDPSHQTEPTPSGPDASLYSALCLLCVVSVYHGYGPAQGKCLDLDGDSSVMFLKLIDGGSWE